MNVYFDIITKGNDIFVACEVSDGDRSYIQARKLDDVEANDTSLAMWCSFLYSIKIAETFLEVTGGGTLRNADFHTRDSVLINQFNGKYKVNNRSIAWVKNKALNRYNHHNKFNLKHNKDISSISVDVSHLDSIKHKDIWKLNK